MTACCYVPRAFSPGAGSGATWGPQRGIQPVTLYPGGIVKCSLATRGHEFENAHLAGSKPNDKQAGRFLSNNQRTGLNHPNRTLDRPVIQPGSAPVIHRGDLP